MSDDVLMVYMTCPDHETAKTLSRGAVEQRLAACANIFQPHESLYWWDGAVQNETKSQSSSKLRQSNMTLWRPTW